jgi:hypothetical protein
MFIEELISLKFDTTCKQAKAQNSTSTLAVVGASKQNKQITVVQSSVRLLITVWQKSGGAMAQVGRGKAVSAQNY